MNINDIDDEDEDVVIEDSPLHEYLYKLGYTDFESVKIQRLTHKNEKKNSKLFDIIRNVKNVFKHLYIIYLGILQDDNISNKQMKTILDAKILLSDHDFAIHNFLNKYDYKSWRTTISKFVLFGTILSSSMYTFYYTQYRKSASLFALTLLSYISYMEFLRINTHIDLKSVVSLQNDCFDLCKKGIKILKYGYKIKLNRGKGFQQFSDLTAGRLKYLQPIMESLVKCMGDISCIYYHTSLILIKLLPINICNEELLTKFESGSFEVHGEINYQKLKILYHTYVLTQSETLHLLAIAYDNYTWRQSYKKVPELKLAYIIRFLIVHLSMYKKKLSDYIDAYCSFKLEPVLYQYKGSNSSKWQDLYMHLYLASNKLQLAYSHILSLLQDIDNDVIENITNEDYMKNTAQKLNAAEKNIETAKDFLEFSCLFLVKLHISDSTINRLQTNTPTSIENSDIRIVADSEPEIIDEVFEEYITEEYLKPLSEGTGEISLYNYNRDKMLFKNFMTELKDALADKKKTMSERESRALQRMYKSIIKTTSDEQLHRIPTPPPMPLFNTFSVIQSDTKGPNNATELQLRELSEKSNINKSITESKQNLTERNINDNSMGKIPPTSNIFLPKSTEFSSFSLPPFLKVEEETFIGNGENSEDDEETKVKNEQKEIT